jgi:hypothetical protein
LYDAHAPPTAINNNDNILLDGAVEDNDDLAASSLSALSWELGSLGN